MKQPISAQVNNLPASNTTYFAPIMGWGRSSTELDIVEVIPTGGTLGSLYAKLSAAPGAGTPAKTRTIAVRVNGADSGVSITFTTSGTTGNDLDTVDVVAGDYVSFGCTAANTPAVSYVYASVLFTGTTSGESILMGNSGGYPLNNAATEYASLVGSSTDGPSATEVDWKQIIPTPGTIKKLYAQLTVDPGSGSDEFRFTARKDGSSQTLHVHIVADNKTGNDTANSFTVAAGNDVTLMIEAISTPSSTTSLAGWGCVFLADTNGESLILGGSPDDLNADAVEYNQPCTGQNSWFSTESLGYQLLNACTLKKFYVELSGAPYLDNANDAYTFVPRDDAANAGSISVAIANLATTGNDTAHTSDVAAGSTIDIRVTPANTPTVRDAYWGIVCYILPVVVYDETGKLQVILAVQGETENAVRAETGITQVILAAQGEADIQAMVETGKEVPLLAVIGEADGFLYNELGLTQAVLAVVGESESLTLDETGKLQVILGVLTSADIQTMQELERLQIILATSAVTDTALFLELGKLQEILAVVGETEALALDETAREQIILSVLGESETLALLETAKLQVVVAVIDETDVQTMQELGITQIVLVVAGEIEAAIYPELGRLQEILSIIGEANTQAMVETAREQIIKFVLASADIQAMVESLEQLILAVVGKKEGRLLVSSRTTSPTRVLDAIREEGVERVLDSEIVT